MANTFTKIASVTVGSGGSTTIDFTSIPATYTDLCLKVSLRTEQSAVNGSYYLNFNSSQVGTGRRLYSDGSNVAADSGYNAEATGNTATSNTFSNGEIYIPNYTSSNYKSVFIEEVTENNATTAFDFIICDLWAATDAITSISLDPSGANKFLQYSTATLYGIKNS